MDEPVALSFIDKHLGVFLKQGYSLPKSSADPILSPTRVCHVFILAKLLDTTSLADLEKFMFSTLSGEDAWKEESC